MTIDTASEAKREAIAQACAELNNVDLPNVYWLARRLKDVVALARALEANCGDRVDTGNDPRIRDAERALARIEPYLPAGI